MIIIKGGVTAPKGFLASGLKAGLKKSGRPDLGLIYSEVPAVAAAAFTSNRFQAAPVKISRLHIRNKTHQAIIVNSGNANCANGASGDRKAEEMARSASRELGLSPKEVLVASTGIIGVPLQVDKIKRKVPDLCLGLSKEGGKDFAQSIMTTDTVRKEISVKIKLGKAVVTIGGACKGVGMLHPSMNTQKHATMLAFITTDAAISKTVLESSLDEAVRDSFNMISVDGDMSTNDTCFILANGLAGNDKISKSGSAYKIFTGALKFLAVEMAKMLVRDGEGATKLIEIDVRGARTGHEASIIARTVSRSNLLKCAVFGADPNWGRVIAAMGSSGVDFNPDGVDVYLGNVKAVSGGGIAKNYDRNAARRVFKDKKVRITIDLNSGKGRAAAWTCDFSKKYVEINSEYST